MNGIRNINPSTLKVPTKAYSQGVVVPLGTADLMFITGQLSQDSDGKVIAPHDAKKQTEVIFSRLATILDEAGMSLKHLVKIQIFVTDMENNGSVVSAVRDEILRDIRPASTMVAISSPVKRGCVVEIEATAVTLHTT